MVLASLEKKITQTSGFGNYKLSLPSWFYPLYEMRINAYVRKQAAHSLVNNVQSLSISGSIPVLSMVRNWQYSILQIRPYESYEMLLLLGSGRWRYFFLTGAYACEKILPLKSVNFIIGRNQPHLTFLI